MVSEQTFIILENCCAGVFFVSKLIQPVEKSEQTVVEWERRITSMIHPVTPLAFADIDRSLLSSNPSNRLVVK